jgi:hypothetical protein
MRAVVVEKPGVVGVRDVPDPVIGPNYVPSMRAWVPAPRANEALRRCHDPYLPTRGAGAAYHL